MTNTFNINTATPEEVFEFAQSKLKKLHDIKYPAYADADLCDSEKAESFTDESITELAGLTFKACSSETGGEGQGEHCEVVFQLGNRYFRFYGNYYSYDEIGRAHV